MSCKTVDLGAISEALAADLAEFDDSPIEAINGLEGDVEEFREILAQVDWSDQDE